ncbi:hypothetical protein K439DRAFT_1647638 [Ramaria rubella]|nr:hypothetical protein K439DRAFT_1647638 [Ramaria rubella]
MSIDLEWDSLFQSSLASNLVDVLNRHLSTTPRPSFIGPITVRSLDFGSAPPDVEVVDIRDVYRDFLEDDDIEPDAPTAGPQQDRTGDDVEGFEWVSRKGVGKAIAAEAPAYHHLPPHIRYGRGPSTDPFSGGTGSPREMWQGTMSVPNLTDIGGSPSLTLPSREPTSHDPSIPAPDDSPQNDRPNLQVHLHITHQSNLRLTLTTSLLINYPSPSFMSLPIKLSVTGLIFTGEVVVAYEGARRRVHICILDDLDPYGPAGDRSHRHPAYSDQSTLPDADSPPRSGKPLPVGLRLLPSIFIESEIGQADKHVLKNVTRVERFIQDVIRKTIEEELIFPNYHTLMLGDP